jgi:hypothetical protein
MPKNPRFEQDEVQQDQDQGMFDKGVCEAGTTGLEVSLSDMFVNGRGRLWGCREKENCLISLVIKDEVTAGRGHSRTVRVECCGRTGKPYRRPGLGNRSVRRWACWVVLVVG